MAVSKVQRIEGVPQFSDTAACLAFVASHNTKAAALKVTANSMRARARNAAKQLPALAGDLNNHDRPEASATPQVSEELATDPEPDPADESEPNAVVGAEEWELEPGGREPCGYCDGQGSVPDPTGGSRECQHCNGVGVA